MPNTGVKPLPGRLPGGGTFFYYDEIPDFVKQGGRPNL